MGPAARRAVDPVDLEVHHHLFSSIAEEMGACLARSASSPNIKERLDLSCAVFTGEGELLAQAAHIPVHLGSAGEAVRSAVESVRMEPGDAVLLNDPYRGGTHLPDLTLVSPVFPGGGAPGFFVASRAHHADVGGGRPGSMGLASDLFGEGLVLPPVKILSRGRMVQPVLDLLLANVRTPEERRGDLMAQIAANSLGVERLMDLSRDRGAAALGVMAGAILDYTEVLVRSSLADLPKGRWRARDEVEDDGLGSGPIPVEVEVAVGGRKGITFDFTATGDQCRGPLNANRPVTLAASVYAVRCLCEGRIPTNGGLFRPLRILTRPGSLVDPHPPAAVAGGNVETSQRIVDVCLAALARAVPHRIPASSAGTMSNLAFGGRDPATGRHFTYYETLPGGSGAGPWGPGTPAIQTHMTNTRNTPVEDLERRMPVRVLATSFREGSGGEGARPGGDGLVREIRFLAGAQVSLLGERRKRGPPGAAGGGAGAPGRDFLVRKGRRIRLPSKGAFFLEPGEAIRVETPGGGGHGRARARRSTSPARRRRASR